MTRPGASQRLGRQTAVKSAVRNDDSSRPGDLEVSTQAMPLYGPLFSMTFSAPSKQNARNVARMRNNAAAAYFSHHIPVAVS
jgi:hypothetical protein